MKIIQPNYYDEFQCVADKCRDSCCKGWEVSIDKESFMKYRRTKGEFGLILNSNIKKGNEKAVYGKMVLKDGKKCYFLNNDNLCDIYINKGAKYLCNTCTLYPRVMYKYGDIIEKNLALSCPKVAEMLVTSTKAFDFIMKDETNNKIKKEHILEIKCDENLYSLLWKGRSFSIQIAQFREIPIWKRLIFIKITEERLQKLIDSENNMQVSEVIEQLRNEVTSQYAIDLLDKINNINNVEKINVIMLILKLRVENGINNDEFKKTLTYIDEFIEKNDDRDIQIKLKEKEIEFIKYFKDKEYVLENYISCNLYSVYMNALKTKDLNKEITRLMINYSIIKLSLMSIWVKNNNELTDDDIINVIYSFSKTFDHDEIFVKSIYPEIKLKGYDSIGYLATIVS